MSEPLVSVVAINWNAGPYIAGCIRSVLESSYKNIEIILVDNHSTDGSLEALRASFNGGHPARMSVIENDRNYGAARALNQGALKARGKYVMFLATDTRIEKDCVGALVRALEKDQGIGGVSAKLLMMREPNRLDSAGEFLNQFGILMQRHAGQEIDNGQFDEQADIFSAKGTALTVRADAFRAAGAFPEDYFMFLEETDLCWRLWLSGYRVVFVPDAVIYHASGISIRSHSRSSYLVKYYGCRNYMTTLMANLGALRLCMIMPAHAGMWVLLGIYLLLRGRKEGLYVLKGVWWNLAHVPSVLKKRKQAQHKRTVADRDLMPRILRPVTFSYLLDRVRMW